MSEPCNAERFEPSPYDLGLTDNPDAEWQDGRVAGPQVPDMMAPNGEPVYLGAAGHLVYDAEPESAAGCFAALPDEPSPYDRQLTQDPGMTWVEFLAEAEAEVS